MWRHKNTPDLDMVRICYLLSLRDIFNYYFTSGWFLVNKEILQIDSITWYLDNVSFLFINMLRPRQNGRNLPDDIFKCIFLNEDVHISVKISMNIVPVGPINNIPAFVQKMA